ncbi:hypothetical protein [Sporocytophaga myxococcoides]|uniref:hypothetical protein n=1 Tax=Sporocytophaga myxococcoides TaxID=153721 RepID=UPI00048FC9B8|nr:hypothetical protein [Sporocytophaga myxococcoides]
MKKILKIFVILFIITILGLGGILMIYKNERDKTFPKNVTHCMIYMDGKIDSLRSIEFIICDSSYSYTVNELKDTISDNFGISDESFPCPVHFKYYYHSGTKRIIKTDSFNLEGWSGANIYMLKKDSVFYKYAS